jgi:hypothetical protein
MTGSSAALDAVRDLLGPRTESDLRRIIDDPKANPAGAFVEHLLVAAAVIAPGLGDYEGRQWLAEVHRKAAVHPSEQVRNALVRAIPKTMSPLRASESLAQLASTTKHPATASLAVEHLGQMLPSGSPAVEAALLRIVRGPFATSRLALQQFKTHPQSLNPVVQLISEGPDGLRAEAITALSEFARSGTRPPGAVIFARGAYQQLGQLPPGHQRLQLAEAVGMLMGQSAESFLKNLPGVPEIKTNGPEAFVTLARHFAGRGDAAHSCLAVAALGRHYASEVDGYEESRLRAFQALVDLKNGPGIDDRSRELVSRAVNHDLVDWTVREPRDDSVLPVSREFDNRVFRPEEFLPLALKGGPDALDAMKAYRNSVIRWGDRPPPVDLVRLGETVSVLWDPPGSLSSSGARGEFAGAAFDVFRKVIEDPQQAEHLPVITGALTRVLENPNVPAEVRASAASGIARVVQQDRSVVRAGTVDRMVAAVAAHDGAGGSEAEYAVLVNVANVVDAVVDGRDIALA